jgi:glyoxylase-like metal-dependent hydrolase (beta-lactamase superfamily II)
MILKTLVVGPLASNCYIVGSAKTKAGMLVDPGDDADTILNAITDSGLNIKLIAITHGHLDHTGALKEIYENIWAEIAMHGDEAESLQGEYQSLGISFGLAYPAPPMPDRFLEDGDIVEIGDLKFAVLHTPGHTRGGVCFYGEGVVFTGDTLFSNGIGRYDLPGSSYDQLMASLSRLMKLPDETVVYPGHGPPTTIGVERRTNPMLR